MSQLIEQYELRRKNDYDDNNSRNTKYFSELKRLQIDLQEDSYDLYNYLNNKMGNLKLLTKILYGNTISIDKDNNNNKNKPKDDKVKDKVQPIVLTPSIVTKSFGRQSVAVLQGKLFTITITITLILQLQLQL